MGPAERPALLGTDLAGHPDVADPDALYFNFVDGPVEESIELIAAAAVLATLLAYVPDLHRGRLVGVAEDQDPDTAAESDG